MLLRVDIKYAPWSVKLLRDDLGLAPFSERLLCEDMGLYPWSEKMLRVSRSKLEVSVVFCLDMPFISSSR